MDTEEIIIIAFLLIFLGICIYTGYYELNLKMQIANTLQLQGIDWWFYILH